MVQSTGGKGSSKVLKQYQICCLERQLNSCAKTRGWVSSYGNINSSSEKMETGNGDTT